MQEYPDDNQMDELFRKSAEGFEPDYDPTAWQAMAVRLDTYDRDHNTPSVWLRRGLAVLLLLWLTGNYGWFSSSRPLAMQAAQVRRPGATPIAQRTVERTDDQSKFASVNQKNRKFDEVPKQLNHVTRQPIETTTNTEKTVLRMLSGPIVGQESPRIASLLTPGNRPERPDIAPLTIPKTPRVGLRAAPTTNSANTLTVRPDSYQAKPEKRNQPVTGQIINKKEQRVQNALAFSLIQPAPASGRTAKPALSGSDNDATQPTPATPDNKLTNFQSPKNGDLTRLQSPKSQEIALLPVRDSLTEQGRNRLTDSVVESPIQDMKPDTGQTRPALRPTRPLRFIVGVVFSPDLSTIGLRNFDRPGTNFGVSVQYQFSRRWSIQTGILQSQKNYQALPSQYQLPPNVKWEVQPSSISGACRMIDLPVNVRYDVSLQSHPTGLFSSARWFVSAGATAYWINREAYQYNYANPDDPAIKYRNWKTSTGRQGISNLNLSIGYERQLNRRFSVQAEPFLKIPLRSIGFFKIRLISTGVFMSVRYRF